MYIPTFLAEKPSIRFVYVFVELHTCDAQDLTKSMQVRLDGQLQYDEDIHTKMVPHQQYIDSILVELVAAFLRVLN